MGIVTRDWGFPIEEIRRPVYMWHDAEDNLASHIPGCEVRWVTGAGHAGAFAYAGEAVRKLVQCRAAGAE